MNKSPRTHPNRCALLQGAVSLRNSVVALGCVSASLVCGQTLRAAVRTWANIGSDFSTGSNWGGSAPGTGDVALFNSAEAVQPSLAGSSNVSISGFRFDPGSSGYGITRSGAGTFTLTGYNSTGSGGSSNSSAAAIRGSNTAGTNTIEVPVILAPGSGSTSYFFQDSGGTLLVKGAISGSGITLDLKGGGAIELDGDVSGVTGGLVLETDVTIGGNSSSTLAGSLTNSGANRTLTVNSTGLTTFAAVNLSESPGSGRTLTVTGSGNVTFGGTIRNESGGGGSAGSLTFNSSYSGTASLNGPNTFSGTTTLNSGVFVIGNSNAFGNSVIALNSNSSGSGVIISSSQDLTGGSSIGNSITDGGTGTLIFAGSHSIELSGTWTDSGTRTLTNNISGGSLILSNSVNLSNGSSNYTLSINGSGQTSITGNITNGSGGSTASKLTFGGTGMLTLSGANSYTGATTIDGGVLAVNGSLASGSAVTVNSGGTLGGTGTVNGAVTVNGGGIVGPGNSPGILTTGNIAFQSASIFSWELGNSVDGDTSDGGDTGVRGNDYDGLTASALSVDSGAIFRVVLPESVDLASNFWNQPQKWTDIFSAAGLPSSGSLFSNVQVYSGNTSITASPVYTSQGIFGFSGSTLTWTAVPEPGTALAGLLLGAGIMRRSRRRVTVSD